LSRDETELDFSGQNLGAGDAVLIANDISDMGALSVLNLASNNLGALVLPEGWTKNYGVVDGKYGSVFTHADGTKQMEHPGKPEGIIALANAIPDMGALTSLNLSSNHLGIEGATIVTEANKVNNCNHFGTIFNCCCLLSSTSTGCSVTFQYQYQQQRNLWNPRALIKIQDRAVLLSCNRGSCCTPCVHNNPASTIGPEP
jgi:hypothetical protein